jgi:DNA-3-methyladenine glycosylase I
MVLFCDYLSSSVPVTHEPFPPFSKTFRYQIVTFFVIVLLPVLVFLVYIWFNGKFAGEGPRLPKRWSGEIMKCRCTWCGNDPLYVAYHDNEWGVPAHDERHLFEMLLLEGAQAGLSWLTILKKRENYRKAFHCFDPEKIAAYSDDDVGRLLADSGIVRNRLKIASAIKNARGVLEIQGEFGSLETFLWRYVDGAPLQNERRSMNDIPARSVQSDAMSKDLKRRGFNFVGTTICYAFMQAVGIVNDHVVDCYRHAEVRDIALRSLSR